MGKRIIRKGCLGFIVVVLDIQAEGMLDSVPVVHEHPVCSDGLTGYLRCGRLSSVLTFTLDKGLFQFPVSHGIGRVNERREQI